MAASPRSAPARLRRVPTYSAAASAGDSPRVWPAPPYGTRCGCWACGWPGPGSIRAPGSCGAAGPGASTLRYVTGGGTAASGEHSRWGGGPGCSPENTGSAHSLRPLRSWLPRSCPVSVMQCGRLSRYLPSRVGEGSEAGRSGCLRGRVPAPSLTCRFLGGERLQTAVLMPRRVLGQLGRPAARRSVHWPSSDPFRLQRTPSSTATRLEDRLWSTSGRPSRWLYFHFYDSALGLLIQALWFNLNVSPFYSTIPLSLPKAFSNPDRSRKRLISAPSDRETRPRKSQWKAIPFETRMPQRRLDLPIVHFRQVQEKDS